MSSTVIDLQHSRYSQQVDPVSYVIIITLTALLFGTATFLIYAARNGHPVFTNFRDNFFRSEDPVSPDSRINSLQKIILASGHIRNKTLARDLARSIVEESVRAKYDPFFVAAVIKHESGFDSRAVSRVGAQGLMQIMPDTGRYVSNLKRERWLGWWRLRDAQYNLRLGIAYLKQLEGQFKGNREQALIAYNWGPGNLLLAKKGLLQVPRSSVIYARSVLAVHRKWQGAGSQVSVKA